MKKKVTIILLFLCLCVAAVGFSACGKSGTGDMQIPSDNITDTQTPSDDGNSGEEIPNPPAVHTHSYSEEWSMNEIEHWHSATCEHTSEIKDKAAHRYDEGNKCAVCGYNKPTEGLVYVLNDNNNSYSVAGIGEVTDKDIIIPSRYKGLPVTGIGAEAFVGCSLTSVSIPDSVTKIEDRAFSYCDSITEIVISDSVTSIGDGAFLSCISLINVRISDKVTNIGINAFLNCPIEVVAMPTAAIEFIPKSKLKDVTITSGKNIGYKAFYKCNKLVKIQIADSVTEIAKNAFFGCPVEEAVIPTIAIVCMPKGKLRNVTITSGESIDSKAFAYSRRLTNVSIPNCIESVSSDAFDGCDNIRYNEYENCYYLGNSANPYVVLVKAIDKNKVISNISDGTKIIFNSAFEDYKLQYNEYDSGLYLGSNENPYFALIKASSHYITTCAINDKTKIIYGGAFHLCDYLESITIPDSVTSIGEHAFSNCSSLKSITIPNSVTSIGEFAFSFCINLTNITIPDNVTSIKNNAFTGCRSLQYNEYEDGLYLGNSVNPYLIFRKLKDTSITSCSLNDKTKIISAYAFSNCSNLTSVTIPDGVTNIGEYAFEGCSSLTSITISDSVTSIGNYAFSNCRSLTSITIPDGVMSIGDYAFYGSGLTNITIPNSITSIGNNAISARQFNEYEDGLYLGNNVNPYLIFIGLKDTSITSYCINDKTKIISAYAFFNCSSLTSITIPDSVTSIGENAFSGCGKLTSVNITDIEAWCYILFENSYSNPLYYAKNLYLNDELVTKLVVLDNMASLDYKTFANCDNLTGITVKDGNTKYRSSGDCLIETKNGTLLKGCNNSVIPSDGSVTSIGDYAFSLCGSLTNVTIPDSVTSIGDYAFSLCGNLKSVTIGNGVTSIGSYAFYKCGSLTNVTIPDSVTSIGDYAFSLCGNLKSVTIGNGVTSIGFCAFEACTSLTSVTIGNSVTSIGSNAFSSCVNLTSITIPNSVTSIGDYVFFMCSKLTIYCEASSKPSGWKSDWNDLHDAKGGYCPVVWGYKG